MSSRFNPRSILVYIGGHPDNAIGENLIKMPFLVSLREQYPDAKITWIPGVGPAQFNGILKNLAHGLIDELITDLDIPQDAMEFLRFRRPLKERHFDLIIDTQRIVARTLALRRISHQVFISGNWNFFFSDKRPPKAVPKPRKLIDKLMVLLSAASGEWVKPPYLIPIPEAEQVAAKKLLPDGPEYVGIAPGAGRQDTGKLWPLEGYVELAKDQVSKGRIPVFILGPDELSWVPVIMAQVPEALAPLNGELPGGIDLTPALTIALSSHLKVAVSNCSGTGHMLAAGGTPMVSLFGPTSPGKFAPHCSNIISIRSQDFGSDMIEAIPVQSVIEAVDKQII